MLTRFGRAFFSSLRTISLSRMSSSTSPTTDGQASPPPEKKLRLDDQSDELELEGAGHQGTEEGERSPGPAKEIEVGITEFASENEGFFGILKRRYSDFLVHELTPKGDVVQLKNYSIPFEDSETDGDEGTLVQLLGEGVATSIRELAQATEEDKNKEVKISTPLDKGQRTLVHKTVRTLYPLLLSETVEVEGEEEKAIIVRHSKNRDARKSSRGVWPRERGSHCKFVLYKENKDTIEAIAVLSRLLKIKNTCFHYAGLKDKRAITSQYVTAFKVPAEKFQAINPKLINMKLGNFEYTPNALKLGHLSGNKFTVILRNVSCEDHVISKAVQSLKEVGFINYYGMQRFGTTPVSTHHVGRYLVHSNWKGAVETILKPRHGDPEDVAEARDYYLASGGDVAGTLTRMPRSRNIERLVLKGLEKTSGNNYLAALQNIPRNTRLLYVHGWQSYCWNKLASWRVRELGLTPVVGDLVQVQGAQESSAESGVQYVTEENRDQYSIHDVVLPLPGYSIQLPKNGTKEEYERILEDEKVTTSDFQNKVRDFALVGAFRHVLVKPKDITSEVFLYDDVTVPLALTDLDHLAGKRPLSSIPDGSLKALKVEFSLPPSSYATVAIRELLKMDTSAGYQATLNNTVP